jgi:uncharacterized protein (DUF433 family)
MDGDEHPIPCVSINPHKRSGEPCITGTRIPVAIIASLVNDGVPPRHIKRWYPGVTADIARHATTWYNTQPED